MVSDPLPTCYGVALQRAMHTYLNFACIFWNPSLRSEIPRWHAHHTRSRPSNAVWGAGPGNGSRKTMVTVLGTRPSLFPLLNGFRELKSQQSWRNPDRLGHTRPGPVFLGCLFGVWSGRNVRGIAWRMECVCFWLGTGNCLLWGLRVCVRCTRLRFSTDTLLLCVARCAGGTSELEAIAPKFY